MFGLSEPRMSSTHAAMTVAKKQITRSAEHCKLDVSAEAIDSVNSDIRLLYCTILLVRSIIEAGFGENRAVLGLVGCFIPDSGIRVLVFPHLHPSVSSCWRPFALTLCDVMLHLFCVLRFWPHSVAAVK
jgi:hypothetical protein